MPHAVVKEVLSYDETKVTCHLVEPSRTRRLRRGAGRCRARWHQLNKVEIRSRLCRIFCEVRQAFFHLS
eukprot:g20638.t1